jgi:hypothetical protein
MISGDKLLSDFVLSISSLFKENSEGDANADTLGLKAEWYRNGSMRKRLSPLLYLAMYKTGNAFPGGEPAGAVRSGPWPPSFAGFIGLAVAKRAINAGSV